MTVVDMGGDAAQAHTMEQQVRKLEYLSPGDFAVIVRNRIGDDSTMSAWTLLQLLQVEVSVKMQGHGRLGFV